MRRLLAPRCGRPRPPSLSSHHFPLDSGARLGQAPTASDSLPFLPLCCLADMEATRSQGLRGAAVLHPARLEGTPRWPHRVEWSWHMCDAPHLHTDGAGRQEGRAEGHPCPAGCGQKVQDGKGDKGSAHSSPDTAGQCLQWFPGIHFKLFCKRLKC